MKKGESIIRPAERIGCHMRSAAIAVCLLVGMCVAQTRNDAKRPAKQESDAAQFVLVPRNQEIKINGTTWKLDELRPMELSGSGLVPPVQHPVTQNRVQPQPVQPIPSKGQTSFH